MSISDPIGDMLTRIRNVAISNGTVASMPSSKIKAEIARILTEEGYVDSYEVVEGSKPYQKILRIRLKYIGERRNRRPLITGLERVSRPGRRVYSQKQTSRGCFRVLVWPLCPPQGCYDWPTRPQDGRRWRDFM